MSTSVLESFIGGGGGGGGGGGASVQSWDRISADAVQFSIESFPSPSASSQFSASFVGGCAAAAAGC